MASLAALMLVYALMFAVVWVFSIVFGGVLTRPSRAGQSPFVSTARPAATTDSPFAETSEERADEGLVTPVEEAILVEAPEEPSRSESHTTGD